MKGGEEEKPRDIIASLLHHVAAVNISQPYENGGGLEWKKEGGGGALSLCMAVVV